MSKEDFVVQGDCLELLKSIPDESVDLIITDPPYGIEYESNRQILDRQTGEEVREKYFSEISNDDVLLLDWIPDAYRILKDSSALYTFCHWKKYPQLHFYIETQTDFDIKNLIVLNKSNHGMGDLKGSYAPKHELLVFCAKGRHLLNFPDGRDKDVWDVSVIFTGAKKMHPNEKNTSWMEKAIVNSSDEGDLILDPFCGSGSTGEAALVEGRDFIGIEIDSDFVEVANERLRKVKDGD